MKRSRFRKGDNNHETQEKELAELDKVFGRPDAKASSEAIDPSMTSDALAVPELLPHGRYVDPRHADGISGASTDEERPAGGLAGTVKRFRKDKSAGGEARAYGWVKATYKDAIEYSGMKQELEGGIMMGAFMGMMVGIGGLGYAIEPVRNFVCEA